MGIIDHESWLGLFCNSISQGPLYTLSWFYVEFSKEKYLVLITGSIKRFKSNQQFFVFGERECRGHDLLMILLSGV